MIDEENDAIEYEPVDVSQYNPEYDNPDLYVPALPKVDVPATRGVNEDILIDYENARATYYEVIEKGKQALDNLLQVAASSEHPRAFEVAGQLIKTISDSNDKIVNLQEQMRKIVQLDTDLNNGESETSGGTVNNTVFVGNMNDFQQMIKKMNKPNEVSQE